MWFSVGEGARSLTERTNALLGLNICQVSLCPVDFLMPFEVWDCTLFFSLSEFNWSVDWNVCWGSNGSSHVHPSLAFMWNQTESKPDTSQRWAGWSTLLISCPHPKIMGKKGLDEPGISCTESGREICCSAQKKPSVHWGREQSCVAKPARDSRRSAELNCSGWVPSSCRELLPSWFAQSPIRVSSMQGLGMEFELCVCTDCLGLIKRLHTVGKEGCFCKSAYAMGVFHLCFNLLRSTETNIQMPVQSRRVLHPLAPPTAVGVFYHVCIGGYTSSSVSAPAASARRKIVPPHPGAMSESLVVTALGGRSDCAGAQQNLEGGSASTRLKQSKWAEKWGRNSQVRAGNKLHVDFEWKRKREKEAFMLTDALLPLLKCSATDLRPCSGERNK